jgi:hypothetical protein
MTRAPDKRGGPGSSRRSAPWVRAKLCTVLWGGKRHRHLKTLTPSKRGQREPPPPACQECVFASLALAAGPQTQPFFRLINCSSHKS